MDANTPAFYGAATFTDKAGNVVARFEDMVPAVVTFAIPLTAPEFTVTASEKSYTQHLEVVEADHGEDE